MSAGPLVVVGDALLDVDLDGTVTRRCPDAPAPVLDVGPGGERVRPGGGALAAVLATADVAGPVHLVTAVGDRLADPATDALLDVIGPQVHVRARRWPGAVPTKTRLRDGATVLARVDRGGLDPAGAPADPGENAATAALLESAGAILVCDYGRGIAADPAVRAALARVVGRVPLVWDPHPRGPVPVRGATVVCPNHDEASTWMPGDTDPRVTAGRLRRRWGADAVAITLGARGAVLDDATSPQRPSAAAPAGADTCGAGDRFAAALVAALARGASGSAALRCAVDRAAAYVRGGGAAALRADAEGRWLVPGHPPPDPAPSAHPSPPAVPVRPPEGARR